MKSNSPLHFLAAPQLGQELLPPRIAIEQRGIALSQNLCGNVEGLNRRESTLRFREELTPARIGGSNRRRYAPPPRLSRHPPLKFREQPPGTIQDKDGASCIPTAQGWSVDIQEDKTRSIEFESWLRFQKGDVFSTFQGFQAAFGDPLPGVTNDRYEDQSRLLFLPRSPDPILTKIIAPRLLARSLSDELCPSRSSQKQESDKLLARDHLRHHPEQFLAAEGLGQNAFKSVVQWVGHYRVIPIPTRDDRLHPRIKLPQTLHRFKSAHPPRNRHVEDHKVEFLR